MPKLIALDLPGGDAFVTELRRIWEGGDAVFPVDQRLPLPARRQVLAAMAPAIVVTPDGRRQRTRGMDVPDGTALVIATSGTTGAPKGVLLSRAAVAASATATSSHLAVDEHDHWLACLPLSHVGGLSVVTRALHTGTRLTVHPGFDARAAEESGATLVSLVATALARVDASRFRTIVLGGSRPPADRPANVVTTYGMTETGSGVVYDGRPLPRVEVRIAADGEIHLRGPMLLTGYRDGTDPKDGDGWLPTGDLGHWLPDGRLHVLGRRGDLIITGGENVWPEAVEAVLTRHPAIADAGVCGIPDPEWGQLVTAAVVPTDGAAITLDDLRGWVKNELPSFCAPRRMCLVPSIPRTALGKIRRGDLPRLVQG